MEMIELERWKPSEADPRRLEYAGQRTAQEVFEELKHRLEAMSYLPDEYFLLATEWENGRKIPRDADIFCTTDYGGSEGVYLDAYLKWYDEEQKKSITKGFITGKTLGESGNDLDRMFLISSAITKAFHGDHATHARYMKIDGMDEDTGGVVVHLSQQEQKAIIEALVEQRERQENAMLQTEQLLRRMTGSITEYINEVGMRPLRLSDYDKAVLAIHDGALNAFKELYPKALEHADDLLIEAAGRPGVVGQKMTLLLLVDVEQFPEPAYRAACEAAVKIADPEKAAFLLAEAQNHVEGLSPSFSGEIASFAFSHEKGVARQIVEQLTPEQVAAAPSGLLYDAVMWGDYRAAHRLSVNGICADFCFADIVRICAARSEYWEAAQLLRDGASISPGNFHALHACVECGAAEVGTVLLDQGMNFELYQSWAENQHRSIQNDTLQALADHWAEIQTPSQETGGMTLG